MVSNWRADSSLPEYLERNGIPGIQGIDTRALTRKLRVRGAMNGVISTEGMSDAEAVACAEAWPGLVGVDYVKEVTHPKAFGWDEADEQSAAFQLVFGPGEGDARQQRRPLRRADIPVVAYDFGIKYNILRCLRQQGFRVQVVPAGTSADEALRSRPAGVFLSNGPGDHSALPYAVEAVSGSASGTRFWPWPGGEGPSNSNLAIGEPTNPSRTSKPAAWRSRRRTTGSPSILRACLPKSR